MAKGLAQSKFGADLILLHLTSCLSTLYATNFEPWQSMLVVFSSPLEIARSEG